MTEQQQLGKLGKNGARRRIVLTVHSLEQQQQISNSAAPAAVFGPLQCLLLRTIDGCPALLGITLAWSVLQWCTMQWRTGLTGRVSAGGLSDFRIWSKPGWEQHRTSVVPSNVGAVHAATTPATAADATLPGAAMPPFKQHPSQQILGRAHRDKSRSS